MPASPSVQGKGALWVLLKQEFGCKSSAQWELTIGTCRQVLTKRLQTVPSVKASRA